MWALRCCFRVGARLQGPNRLHAAVSFVSFMLTPRAHTGHVLYGKPCRAVSPVPDDTRASGRWSQPRQRAWPGNRCWCVRKDARVSGRFLAESRRLWSRWFCGHRARASCLSPACRRASRLRSAWRLPPGPPLLRSQLRLAFAPDLCPSFIASYFILENFYCFCFHFTFPLYMSLR